MKPIVQTEAFVIRRAWLAYKFTGPRRINKILRTVYRIGVTAGERKWTNTTRRRYIENLFALKRKKH